MAPKEEQDDLTQTVFANATPAVQYDEEQEQGVKNERVAKTKDCVDSYWDSWFIKGISDFVRVPNLSPAFDSEYATNGLL